MTDAAKVLLISPRFFGYELDIAQAFERRGFAVEFIDERPSNSAAMKALFRVQPKALARSVDRYYRRLRVGQRDDYALVLVIKGEVVPAWFLDDVARRSPRAKFVFYTFDSVANSPHAASLMPLFEHRFSFEEHAGGDGGFVLKHLFYVPEFRPVGTSEPRRHDLAFIGTLHSGRYRFVKRVVAGFSRSFTYFYSQARWFFAIKRVTDARFREVPPADVHYAKLDRSTVAEIFRNSLAVLDMQHEQQRGLTMRSFEVLASGSYLVTTNEAAATGPLGATGRVIVMSPEPSPVEISQLSETLRALPIPTGPPAGFEQYSVDAWVQDFVDIAEERAR